MPWVEPRSSDVIMADVKPGLHSPRFPPHNTPPRFYPFRWLDVRDPPGTWLEAQIMTVDTMQKRFLVHYKGYTAEKYDEWLSMSDTERYAPLHTHTRAVYPRISPVALHPGVQVDVLDSIDVWRLSSVQEVNRERMQVLVHYLEFDAKYDEWINTDSYRLAPLHRYTRPKPPKVKTLIQASVDNELQYRLALKKAKNWQISDMDPDGNCLFRSISHQVYGTADFHAVVRRKCMEYVQTQARFFQGYVDEDFKHYVERLKYDGEWGGEIEIRAMGEIYRRPVEIYVYSMQPRTVYRGPVPHAPPIRLSYHWNSHYNSIVDPDMFDRGSAFLRSSPGELEDERIRWGGRLERESDEVISSEERQMREALAASRQDFEVRDLNETYSRLLLAQTEEAKRISLQEDMDDIDKAILRSLQLESANSATVERDNVDELERVRMISLQEARARGVVDGLPLDDLERAQLLSMREFEQKTDTVFSVPPPIARCIEMGFERTLVENAYSLFCQEGDSDDVVTSNMLAFLQANL